LDIRTGALLGRGIKRVSGVYWLEELGLAQAIWVLEVESFGPFLVESDLAGNSLFERENAKIGPRSGEALRRTRPLHCAVTASRRQDGEVDLTSPGPHAEERRSADSSALKLSIRSPLRRISKHGPHPTLSGYLPQSDASGLAHSDALVETGWAI